ncbi:ABC transporter ATP-binding protein [Ornithinibacillus halophilus]|uniref:Amino acid/amide ABC transporter ATP-binding protein 2, HAAT family n=1 Tax=Ornithinibacillus halophilus TaxID=930117 RepID=A0A1M5ER97_9BACI|nr:ABC transporter ATP-binding protein [Ornithinibacillus halophilus]SHF81808.1 amino acid/amide ABC transporter ATP-binding protein 2, HAAT family [Ornithinibacillus halophilus]
MNSLLNLNQVAANIGQYHILHDISFEVPSGGVTVLLGRNGAGKTTTLRTIMGLNPASKGSITFKNEEISRLKPHIIANRGIGYVPEDQGIFGDLTVGENIRVAMKKEDEGTTKRMEWVLELFPDLKKFWKKPGGQLSGGQKQMLAIARAYVNENELLLIDEPSKGLAPIIVEKVMDSINQMKEKTTILLVEQNFMMASKIGDQFYIIDDGQTIHNGQMEELKEDKVLMKKYLGIS